MSGALAIGTPRLEVALLPACLRDQLPESDDLSWLCLQSMCIEALLVTRRLKMLIDNSRSSQIGSATGFFPGNPSSSEPAESLVFFGLNSLIFFCGIYGNEFEEFALIAKGKNHFYLAGGTFFTSLLHILIW